MTVLFIVFKRFGPDSVSFVYFFGKTGIVIGLPFPQNVKYCGPGLQETAFFGLFLVIGPSL